MSNLTKPKNQTLSFDDLKLDTIVIELRYKFVFLFWDLAGELWQEVEDKLPGEIQIGNASPASVSVIYAEKYDIIVEQERFAISTSHPKATLSEFLEILKIVFDTVTDKLKIETFNRIGFRQIFIKEYSTVKKAVEALRNIPSVVIPEKLLSEHKKDFIAPGLVLRVEDEAKGTLFSLRASGRTFEVTIPAIFDKESDGVRQIYQQSFLSFDADFYTKKEIRIGQLSITDWVKQAHEAVKRDAKKFF